MVCWLLLVFVGAKVDACLGSPLHNTLVHFLRVWFVWFGSFGLVRLVWFVWFGVPVFLTALHRSGSSWSLGHWTSSCSWLLVLACRLWDCLHVGGSPVSHIWWIVFVWCILAISFSSSLCVCSSSSTQWRFHIPTGPPYVPCRNSALEASLQYRRPSSAKVSYRWQTHFTARLPAYSSSLTPRSGFALRRPVRWRTS